MKMNGRHVGQNITGAEDAPPDHNTMTLMNAALNIYIQKRGLLTPLEQEHRVKMQRMNAARRKGAQ